MTGLKLEDLKLFESDHWIVYLDSNQRYLGKLIIWCKGDRTDFLEVDKEEEDDFFTVARKFKAVLANPFQPDLFNYNSLGNENPHLHTHLIPRYKGKRDFCRSDFRGPEIWEKPPSFREPRSFQGDGSKN